MYMFRLRAADGGATFVPLTVLDDRKADVLVVSAITTWNAYNTYGGASLYDGDGGRSKVVTFDRPYHASGSGHFFGGEYELVQLVESMGLDVAYTTNIDLHARPEQIQAGGYKVVISLAHDEYYSVPIRQALESARDRGVNLMFLGANAGFRRIRLEPSEHGPHRLEVNYRGPEGGSAARHRRPGAGHRRVAGGARGPAGGVADRQLLRVEPGEGRHGGRRRPSPGSSPGPAWPPVTASSRWCRTSTTG